MSAEYRFQMKTVRYLPSGKRDCTVASYGSLDEALAEARSEVAQERRFARKVTVTEGSAVVYEAVAEAN